jgi:hypothetical protein
MTELGFLVGMLVQHQQVPHPAAVIVLEQIDLLPLDAVGFAEMPGRWVIRVP